MDLEAIPKSFWHSASFALIAFTLGFLFISFQYGDLTVKFKELEVKTTSTLALEDSIKAQEDTIQKREAQIAELETLLDTRAQRLKAVEAELAKLQAGANQPEQAEIVSQIETLSENDDWQQDYNNRKETLNSLQQQQEQQQQLYESQRNFINIQQQRQILQPQSR